MRAAYARVALSGTLEAALPRCPMAQPPTFDLQSHSTHSDGALPPAEVVARAHAAGVELFALTDHDTIGGVAEALAAGEQLALRVVPAIELSSLLPDGTDVHVLGYNVDHTDAVLLEALEAYRADRESRGERMAQALIELGWQLDRTEIDARVAQGLPIGRPHIAQAASATRRTRSASPTKTSRPSPTSSSPT